MFDTGGTDDDGNCYALIIPDIVVVGSNYTESVGAGDYFGIVGKMSVGRYKSPVLVISLQHIAIAILRWLGVVQCGKLETKKIIIVRK